jgi:hypothetical protein
MDPLRSLSGAEVARTRPPRRDRGTSARPSPAGPKHHRSARSARRPRAGGSGQRGPPEALAPDRGAGSLAAIRFVHAHPSRSSRRRARCNPQAAERLRESQEDPRAWAGSSKGDPAEVGKTLATIGRALDGSALQEREHVRVDLILVRRANPVRHAGVDFQCGCFDELRREHRRGADRHDLVVVAVRMFQRRGWSSGGSAEDFEAHRSCRHR